ncbi:VOC family protein [Ancylobacter sp. 6x-1]|uniref:VOC family protein n=1 Tax=Ancylobacter crimeensis TaxID=2579147 RepID=A0ABT0D6G8_9HYPH|nr:VOC family protein [Ancylobacter crimeensis]MCK0195545.1 VOC family protein [Ancylobacter crimeensis]
MIQPYLYFDGRCDEAIAFYGAAIGARVEGLMRFRDAPPPSGDAGCPAPQGARPDPDKVMHAELRIGASTLLVSDGFCGGAARFEGFALALTARDAPEVEQRCTALAEGGRVMLAPHQTFFAERFAMLSDRFGVSWTIWCPPVGR